MRERTCLLLVRRLFLSEFSLFPLFENHTVPTGKTSTLYSPSVFL